MKTIHNNRGGITVTVLILVVLLAITMPAWLGYVALQKRVTSEQEQEERSSQISEAGVQYVIFLLNNQVCTAAELAANSPIVQTVTDADNTTTVGTYQLNLTANGDGVAIEAHGYSAGTLRRCQAITADLEPAWSTVNPKYYINRQDFLHQTNCAASLPAATTISCAGA